jgi:hypothetical protein
MLVNNFGFILSWVTPSVCVFLNKVSDIRTNRTYRPNTIVFYCIIYTLRRVSAVQIRHHSFIFLVSDTYLVTADLDSRNMLLVYKLYNKTLLY